MAQPETVTVLFVPVGGDPEMRTVPNTLQAKQKLVGGRLGMMPLSPSLHLYNNDDGLAKGLPYNRCGMVGDFYIAKVTSAGNSRSLNEKDVRQVEDWLERNHHYPPLCIQCGKLAGYTFRCQCGDVLLYCLDCVNDITTTLCNRCEKKAKRRTQVT